MTDRVFTANVVLIDPDNYGPRVFLIGDEVPEWAIVGEHVCTSEGTTALVQTDGDGATGDESGDGESTGADADKTDEEDEIPPYEEWSKTDLRNEVDGRELDVPAKANIADLVAALQADDAANAETE